MKVARPNIPIQLMKIARTEKTDATRQCVLPVKLSCIFIVLKFVVKRCARIELLYHRLNARQRLMRTHWGLKRMVK